MLGAILVAVAEFLGLHQGVPLGATAVALLIAIPGIPVWIVGSPWRVPREWSVTLDGTAYAAVFGLSLGFALLTAWPSAGFLAVLVWSADSASPTIVMATMAVFALGRTAPFIALSAQAAVRRRYPGRELERAVQTIDRLGRTELAVLTVLLGIALWRVLPW